MPEKKIMTVDEFAKFVKGGQHSKEKPDLDLSGIRLQGFPLTMEKVELEPGDTDSRTVTFVVVTDQRNRNGWRINPDGWGLDNYAKNPVFLWSHDESRLPLGRAVETWIEANKLKAKIEFTPSGMSRFNDMALEMVKTGYLNAVSAGFQVVAWEWVEGPEDQWYLDFIEQELWEISLVTIPADPGALRVAAKACGNVDLSPFEARRDEILEEIGLLTRTGIDITPFKAWARQVLDEPRYVMRGTDGMSPEAIASLLDRFKDFYPSAKCLALADGISLSPFNEDTVPVVELTPKDLDPQPGNTQKAEKNKKDFADGSEPDGVTQATGISVGADDPKPEGKIRSLREARIRELALMDD